MVLLPVLVSQLVVVLKDTAIGYQITFVEMVRQGTVVGSTYGNYVPALIVIAVIMITVNFALSAAATRIERRMRRSKRGATPLEAEALEGFRALGCEGVLAGFSAGLLTDVGEMASHTLCGVAYGLLKLNWPRATTSMIRCGIR